jgi:hypothetical protein
MAPDYLCINFPSRCKDQLAAHRFSYSNGHSGYWAFKSFSNLKRAYQIFDDHLLVRENGEWQKFEINTLTIMKADRVSISFKRAGKKYVITPDFTGYPVLLAKLQSWASKEPKKS